MIADMLPAGEEFERRLQSMLDSLHGDGIVYFPVRHHSPACAWYLRRLILEVAPCAVLIEGPRSFSELIPLIVDERTLAPFAVYVNFVDTEKAMGPMQTEGPDLGPARFAAYFPFCDYSPELVALRAAHEIGAASEFIDLDYPQQVLAEFGASGKPYLPRTESLLAERHLQRSRYLGELAQRTGCRDANDLWDHLFEADFKQSTPQKLMRDVAAYCFIARENTPSEQLRADGTLAREAAMAQAIHAALQRRRAENRSSPIVVVTGGFHTVVLPDLVEQLHDRNTAKESLAKETPPSKKEEGASRGVLIRYSFDQLNALNGYSAGMPSPEYYNRIWRELADGSSDPHLNVASRFLVEIGSLTRDKQMEIAVSTADEIAALQQARLLAAHRGHRGPLREDLLDAVRSCFVKGSIEAEGAILLGIADHLLGGTAIGDVPAEAGVPPIVASFRAESQKRRLNISNSVRRKLSLDLYRSDGHRASSRFLHRLNFLRIPFAQLVAGPDFVNGTNLERLHEHWEYSWSPRTESSLVDCAIYGATIEEAAIYCLKEAAGRLGDRAQARSAPAAVAMLVSACRMGLHEHCADLLVLIAGSIGEDASFASVVSALNQLLLLWQSREPLQAHALTEVVELIGAAYLRACYLVTDLAACPDTELMPVLQALLTMRETLCERDLNFLDAEFFWEPVSQLPDVQGCRPAIAGAMAGLLHSGGRLDQPQLLAMAMGYLGGTCDDWQRNTGFLHGLLHTCRELAWQNVPLMHAIDAFLSGLDESEFLRALPEFRLAFAALTPRETDKAAGVVAGLHGQPNLGNLLHRGVNESELARNRQVAELVLASLREDGLDPWDREVATN